MADKVPGKSYSRKRKIDEIHINLKNTLALDYLDECVDNGRSAKRFRLEARKYLVTESDRAEKDPIEIMDKLERIGHIAPGSYDKLIELARPVDTRMVDIIEEKQMEIRELEGDKVKCSKHIHKLSALAENILANTNLQIAEHESGNTYVTLPHVTECEQILDIYGILALVGRRGTGKTSTSLEILSRYKKKGYHLTFKLNDLTQWDAIVNGEEKCCVWLENVLENNGFSIEANKSHFESIRSSSRIGKNKVILTMSSNMHEICQSELKLILKSENVLNLNHFEDRLKYEDRLKILKSHLQMEGVSICSNEDLRRKNYNAEPDTGKFISESDVDEIVNSQPYLGYPFCCHLFASNFEHFHKGPAFFHVPTKQLVNAINDLRLSENVSKNIQYLALSYLGFNDDEIELDNLNFPLVQQLLDLLGMGNIHGSETSIRKGAEILLKRSLLRRKPQSLTLEYDHSCIKIATFISFAKVSTRAKEKVLCTMTTSMLKETINLHPMESDEVHIDVPESLNETFAKELLKRVSDGDYAAFSIASWNDPNFFEKVVKKTNKCNPILNDYFRYICRYNHYKLVRWILRDKISSCDNPQSSDKATMQLFPGLKEACIQGHPEVVQSIFDDGILLSLSEVIDLMSCGKYNTELCALILDNMDRSSITEDNFGKLLKTVIRDKSIDVLKYIDKTIGISTEQWRTVANIAGRTGSLNCIRWLLETHRSSEIIEEILKGSCVGDSITTLTYVVENFPDEATRLMFECLRCACTAGLPSLVADLLQRDSGLNKDEVGKLLEVACCKGNPLVVKVLIDNTNCLSTTDIMNAVETCISKNQPEAKQVLVETYGITLDDISVITENVLRRLNIGCLSNIPPTPMYFQSVPSVQALTPCLYNQKQKQRECNTKTWRRCKHLDLRSNEANKYRKAMELNSLCRSETGGYTMRAIRDLLDKDPKIPKDLLGESLLSSYQRGHVQIVLCLSEYYPEAWKLILKSMYTGETVFNDLIVRRVHDAAANSSSPRLQSYLSYATNQSIDTLDFIAFLRKSGCQFTESEIQNTIVNFVNEEKIDLVRLIYLNLTEFSISFLQHLQEGILSEVCFKCNPDKVTFLMQNVFNESKESITALLCKYYMRMHKNDTECSDLVVRCLHDQADGQGLPRMQSYLRHAEKETINSLDFIKFLKKSGCQFSDIEIHNTVVNLANEENIDQVQLLYLNLAEVSHSFFPRGFLDAVCLECNPDIVEVLLRKVFTISKEGIIATLCKYYVQMNKNDTECSDLVVRCLHEQADGNGLPRLQSYLRYTTENTINPIDFVRFLKRNECHISDDEIQRTLVNFALIQDIPMVQLLSSNLAEISATLSTQDILFAECSDNNDEVVKFLLTSILNVDKETIITAMRLCYLSESFDVLRVLCSCVYVTNEEIAKEIVFCCKNDNSKSLAFYVENHSSILWSNAETVISSLCKCNNEQTVMSVITNIPPEIDKKKWISELFVAACEKGWISIIREIGGWKQVTWRKSRPTRIPPRTILKGIYSALKKKRFDVLNTILSSWINFYSLTPNQMKSLLSSLFSDRGIEVTLRLIESGTFAKDLFCVLISFKRDDILKIIFENSSMDTMKLALRCTDNGEVLMVTGALPSLTGDQCVELIKSRKKKCYVSSVATLMITKYELRDNYIEEILLELCKFGKHDELQTFITQHKNSLSEESLLAGLEAACMFCESQNVSYLLEVCPQQSIKVNKYTLSFLFRHRVGHYSTRSKKINNELWRILNKNYNNTAECEDLVCEGDVQPTPEDVWGKIQLSFRDLITPDMIVSIMKICCQGYNYTALSYLLEIRSLNEEEVNSLFETILTTEDCHNRYISCSVILKKYPADRPRMYNILQRLLSWCVWEALRLLDDYSEISEDIIYSSLYKEIRDIKDKDNKRDQVTEVLKKLLI